MSPRESAPEPGFGDALATAAYEEHQAEIKARRSLKTSESQRKAWYDISLIRLGIALDQARNPALRKSLALLALGYANSGGKYERSIVLVEELLQHDHQGLAAARWFAELGGIYVKLSVSSDDPLAALKKADAAFAHAIGRIESSPDRHAPKSYYRLIFTQADRGSCARRMFELSKDVSHREAAAAHYRAGAESVAALRVRSASGERWKSARDSGGHGGDNETYSAVLESVLRMRHDEDSFTSKANAVQALEP
jgi:hypothetical protein